MVVAKKGTACTVPFLNQVVGENVTRTETKSNPKTIKNSGHHRSTQDTDSFDALISTFSFYLFHPNREPKLRSICGLWFCCEGTLKLMLSY